MQPQNTNFFERIELISESQGFKSINKFALDGLGYTSSEKINRLRDPEKKPSFDIVVDITNKFENIDANWLLSGKGNMLKKDESNVMIEDEMGIPLIPISAMAGWGQGELQVMESQVQRYIVDQFKNIPADFMIKVSGPSMEKTYYNGDLVACKKLELHTFYQWNKIYVLDTSQGALIKRVQKSNKKDSIICESDNKEYQPFELPLSEIYSLSIVLKGISFRSP